MFTVHGKEAQDVATLPDVTYISPDRPVQGKLDYVTAAVNASLAWQYGWSGKDIGIAIIDSGISQGLDFELNGKGQVRVVYSESFGNSGSTVDSYGHGTHVAGIAAGDGTASGGRLRGIAPGANLINLRVLNGTGAGTDSGVIAAILRAIQLKDKYNIRVINLSLGRPVFESYRVRPALPGCGSRLEGRHRGGGRGRQTPAATTPAASKATAPSTRPATIPT